VFGWISQTVAVILLGVRTIPRRLGSSAVAVIGVAGVVIVFVAVLSIAEGFRAAVADAGSPENALVMRSGADSEMTSGLGGPEADLVKQAPGLLRVGNRPVASAELYVIVDLPKRTTGTTVNVPLRGGGS
jgi:putative ABC transport system permease protein